MRAHAKQLRQLAGAIPAGVFACMELDFRNQAHAACVAAQFGEAAWMQAHYPSLANAYDNTRSAPPVVRQAAQTGFCSKATVLDVGYDQVSGTAYAMGTMTLDAPAERLCLTIDVYEEDKRIAHNSKFYCACVAGQIEVQSDSLPPLEDGKLYRAYLQATWQPQNTQMLRSMVASAQRTASSKNVVKSVSITHPIHRKTPQAGAIKVAYARQTAELDYCYPETRNPTTKNEMVLLDIEGRMTLEDGYHVSSVSGAGAILSCTGFGDILYLGAVKYGKEAEAGVTLFPVDDGASLGWKFEQNWQNEIEDSVRYGNRNHDLEIGITFRCKEDQNEYDLLITSKGTELVLSQPHVEQISQIHLYWGCLASGTMITMADGGKKAIEDIAPGDMVRADTGKAAKVTGVTDGTEENIYLVCLENGLQVKATRTHPFLTDNGYAAVIDLTSHTKLMTENGLSGVLCCYPQSSEGKVYSLELEDGDGFFADGVVSGTGRVMGELADRYQDARLSIAPKAEIAEECRRMEEDFQKGLL